MKSVSPCLDSHIANYPQQCSALKQTDHLVKTSKASILPMHHQWDGKEELEVETVIHFGVTIVYLVTYDTDIQKFLVAAKLSTEVSSSP